MTSVHLLNQPVVFDLGSGLTKGGYAGTPEPSVIVGTLVGTPRLPKVLPTSSSAPGTGDPTYSTTTRFRADTRSPTSLLRAPSQSRVFVVGEELQKMSGVLTMHHPVERGVVQDWNAAEQLWRHVAHDVLSVTPGEHPYLITEAALNPRANREKLAQFFFESLSAPSLHIALPSVLALFASGRTSGLVLDVGDTVCTALPIAQGHCDIHAMRRIDIGGRDVTDRLLTLLRKSGASLFATSSERQAVRRMKERLCYTAVSPSEEELRATESNASGQGVITRSFDLPDGNVVRIGAERFRAPEIIFQPNLVGREFGGVADTINAAISGVDIGLRRNMYSSMLLAVRSLFFFPPSLPPSLIVVDTCSISKFLLEHISNICFVLFCFLLILDNSCVVLASGRLDKVSRFCTAPAE